MPEALPRIERLRGLLPAEKPIQVDGGVGRDNVRAAPRRGRDLFVAGTSTFGRGRHRPGRTASSSKRRT